jgi:hypothetical protein
MKMAFKKKWRLAMKKTIPALIILLFLGLLYGDADLDAIMKVNASLPASNVPHAKWVFTATGSDVKVYMIGQKTANSPNTIFIRVDSAAATTIATFTSTKNAGESITISGVTNRKIFISMRNRAGAIFPAWDTASDGYGRVKVLGFPGYEKPGFSIPSGLWLGWEDTTNTTAHRPYDYSNFCVVLTGCQAKFVVRNCSNDAVWDTSVQVPRNIRMTSRIIDRTVENKY